MFQAFESFKQTKHGKDDSAEARPLYEDLSSDESIEACSSKYKPDSETADRDNEKQWSNLDRNCILQKT